MTAAAVLALAACSTYSPMPIDPFAEMDALEQRASTSGPLPVVNPGREEWIPLEAEIDLSDGLTLAEANALALFYSPEIIGARRKEKVSAAQLLQAGLLSNPELFVGPRWVSGESATILPASLSMAVPRWGELGAEEDIARAELLAARTRVLKTELDVLTRVREQFIRINTLRRSLAILDGQMEAGTKVLSWVVGLQKTGEVDAVSAFLARLAGDEIRADRAEAKLELDSARRDLFRSIGLLPSADLSFDFSMDPAVLPALPDPDRKSLLRHPDLHAALADYGASEAAVCLEIAKQWPGISIGAEFEDDEIDTSFGFGLGITLPIFDMNGAAILAAREKRRWAADQVRTALLSMAHAEARARAEWIAVEKILTDYRAGALSNADQARKSLDARLKAGESDVLEVLTSLRAIAGTRVRELDLIRKSATARFRAAVAGGAVLKKEKE